jgi:type IV fimbrial biogenesis protein FimT
VCLNTPDAKTRNLNRHPRGAGFTLVELLVSVALAAIVATLGSASYAGWVETRHLHDTAHEIGLNLHLARTAALNRQERVSATVLLGRTGHHCHVVHAGPVDACRCTANGASHCDADTALLRTITLSPSQSVRLQSTAASIHFDPRAGTATPAGRVTVTSRSGRQVQNVVSATGRVRRCASSNQELAHAMCPTP